MEIIVKIKEHIHGIQIQDQIKIKVIIKKLYNLKKNKCLII